MRVGTDAVLRHVRVTVNIAVPVSAGLLHDVMDYYTALTAYRRGELRPTITAFARAAKCAVVHGRQLVRNIGGITSDWDDKMRGLRSDAAARRVCTSAIAHPMLNSDIVVRRQRLTADSFPRTGLYIRARSPRASDFRAPQPDLACRADAQCVR